MVYRIRRGERKEIMASFQSSLLGENNDEVHELKTVEELTSLLAGQIQWSAVYSKKRDSYTRLLHSK